MRVGKVTIQAGRPGEQQAAPSASSEPSAASMIVEQNPAPGQKIVAGTTVNFEVR
jgi:beta-lactam-binding protein with PASTA domain